MVALDRRRRELAVVEPVVKVIDRLHRDPHEWHGADGVPLDGSGDRPVAVDRALLAATGRQVVDVGVEEVADGAFGAGAGPVDLGHQLGQH